MRKIQEKWRESKINIKDIKFKNINFKRIYSYPPAGNDVFDCLDDNDNHFFVKSERGSFANFQNEIKVLNKLNNILPVPIVIESGKIKDYTYIVLTEIKGEKLSDIFKKQNQNSKDYLLKYGKMIGKIHNLNINWEKAKQRDINDYPKYENLDVWETKIINYLKENKPNVNYNTFIHGDFHYGNILWQNKQINGILDWEYAGMGFKEQDIAWALILRPNQKFMDNKEDIEAFLEGYKSINTYNQEKLKWCYLNGSMHFYLMNKEKDAKYATKLKSIIDKVIEM